MARVHLYKPRLSRPLLWAGLCVTAAAVTVQITRTGVDVLVLMMAGFLLLLLERTIGDWIAESLGPATTALVFAGIAAMGVWYVMTTGGRAKVQRLFAIAEARGYHTMYVTLDDDIGPGTEGNETTAISDAVRDAGDAVTPSAADGRATSPRPRSTSATPPASRSVNPSGGGIMGGGVPSVRGPDTGAPGFEGGTAEGPPARTSGEELGDSGALRIVRLMLNPEIVMTGDRVTMRAQVIGRSDPAALIEFSINGHTVSTALPGSDGIAKATFSTRLPGQYTVRARIVGGPIRITEVSALLNVLPGRR